MVCGLVVYLHAGICGLTEFKRACADYMRKGLKQYLLET
jgi:hypothetical protein